MRGWFRLPPGTPAYRSPEAHAFVQAFRRHPTAHYPASTCDDLFALGVMAYRLVTDEYPPSTHPEDPGSEVWREGGGGPRPARELNLRVSPELDAFISRLLAQAPEERFYGQTREAAEALAKVARRAWPPAASPLFAWGYDHTSRVRSPDAAQLAAQKDAAARQKLERREAEEKARVAVEVEQRRRSAFGPAWATGAVALLMLMLVLVTARWPRGDARRNAREDGNVSVGDGATSPAISILAPAPQDESVPQLARPLPEKPLPGQRQPPCSPSIETAVRGACWLCLAKKKPPCGNTAYDWEDMCCIPSFNAPRQPTSNPPK